MNSDTSRPFSPLFINGFFRLQSYACRYIGAWPMDDNKFSIIFFFNIFALSYNVMGQFLFGIKHLNNLHLALDSFAPFGIIALALYKSIVFGWQKKKHRIILMKLYEFYKNGKLNYYRLKVYHFF